jgi:hypothetical protein
LINPPEGADTGPLDLPNARDSSEDARTAMPQHTTANSPEKDPSVAVDGDELGGALTEESQVLVDTAEFDAASETYASDFTDWVDSRRTEIAVHWGTLVAQRTGRSYEPVDPLLARFYDLCLRLLPACLGPYRSQFVPLFRTLAELYGSVGAARGLAAGEIIEEVQILRDLLIRRLFAEPPRFKRAPVLLREILRLNRLVDRSVTYASVGHTDAMFFTLFQGSGVPAVLSDELRGELNEQLDEIEKDTKELLRILSRQ